MEILKQRERKHVVDFALFFQAKSAEPGCGYEFPCDAFGNLLVDKCYDSALENFDWVKDSDEYEPGRIVPYERDYVEPAIARCVCGNEFDLVNEYMGACECHNCGRWYNLYGQRLLNPEFWENDEEEY